MRCATPLVRLAATMGGRLLLCVMAAAASAAAFPPFNLHWLMWIGLIPLLCALSDLRPRDAAAYAGVFGFSFFGLTVHWLWGLFGAFSLSLFVIYALFYALFGWLYAHAKARSSAGAMALLTPTLWVATEYLRAECWALRFGWSALGYSQVDTPVMQLASAVGVYGVTWLIVLVNALLFWTAARPADRGIRLCWLAGSLLAGGVKLSDSSSRRRGESRSERVLEAACVQGEEVGPDEYARAARGLGKVDLLVLPEYALYDDPRDDRAADATFRRLATDHGAHVVLGCKRYTSAYHDRFRNTAAVLSPTGSLVGEYCKRNPLPFFSDGVAGSSSRPIGTSVGRLGIAICFDADFEKPCRETVQDGAEILIIPTFDSRAWGDTMRRQHEAMPRFRAVETRRYVVRCASSGYSMLVGPDGRVIKRARGTEPEAVSARVALQSGVTAYVRWGWRLPRVCIGVACLGAMPALLRRRRRPRSGAAGYGSVSRTLS